MLIFGHKFIQSETFYHVTNIEDIKNTPNSSLIYLQFNENNLDIIKHLNLNSISFALFASNVEEIVYASALDAKYIVVNKELAKIAHDIAQNYLFDAKILVRLKREESIKKMALVGVDGVIFANAIV